MEKSNRFWRGFFCGLGVTVIVVLGTYAGVKASDILTGAQSQTLLSKETESKVELINRIIKANYLEEVEDKQMTEGLYSGLLDALGDPYSVYYTEEDYSAFQESVSGTYCGIGASLLQDKDTGIITVVRTFQGSPSYEEGITTGDILYKVEGEEVTGQDLSTVTAKVKGEPGTKVHVSFVRNGEILEKDLERREIEVPTVEYKMLENQIGYIQIAEFDEVTAVQFENALADLKSQGMESVIFDLRDNPGGYLNIVVKMLDSLLPEGILVYTEDKYGNREEYRSDENKTEFPVAVLINGNSASASEIFAGAIKDYKAGTLVGTTTFGKGIVQTVKELGDNTALKLTVSKYYTPSGVCIHGTGIEPDIEVKLDYDKYLEDGTDNQLNEAIQVLSK